MAQNKLRQLEKYKRKLAALEREVRQEQDQLRTLPRKLGFKSVEGLIAALRSATGRGAASAPKAAAPQKRRYAKIPAEVKGKVKALVTAMKTSAQIARQLGISLPSVSNIRKELGLVKKRK
jgi:hypothetical protein